MAASVNNVRCYHQRAKRRKEWLPLLMHTTIIIDGMKSIFFFFTSSCQFFSYISDASTAGGLK